MRLTPAQIGMLQLLGERFPMGPEQTVKERVRSGHALLVRITGQDFGLHPDRWHAHLTATNAGGSRWSNKHRGVPARIRQAVADPEWQRAVAELRSGSPGRGGGRRAAGRAHQRAEGESEEVNGPG